MNGVDTNISEVDMFSFPKKSVVSVYGYNTGTHDSRVPINVLPRLQQVCAAAEAVAVG